MRKLDKIEIIINMNTEGLENKEHDGRYFLSFTYFKNFMLSHLMTFNLSDSGSNADFEDSTSEQEKQPVSDKDISAEEEPLDDFSKLK